LRANFIDDLPKEIVNLTNLEHLDLSENVFTNFPNEIYSLTNLRVLDLTFNCLKDPCDKLVLEKIPSILWYFYYGNKPVQSWT